MESFDLNNVWNMLTDLERETLIDAAKDSYGVGYSRYASVVKGILLSAIAEGRVNLCYRDVQFWDASGVLREQGIAEVALRQQKAKQATETPTEVDETAAAPDSMTTKPSVSAIEKLVLQAAEPPVWEVMYTPAWLQTANDKLEVLRLDIEAEANLIKSTFVPRCVSAVASNYASLVGELNGMSAALRLFQRINESDHEYTKLVRDQLAAIAYPSSGVWFYTDPIID